MRDIMLKLLLTALPGLLLACGDGGVSHFPLTPPAKYDLSNNTWYATETGDSFACDGSTVMDTPVYSIVQVGGALTITDETNGTGAFSASMEDDKLRWSRRYSASGGTVDADFFGTASSQHCFNGTVTWVWSDGVTSCFGSTTISANTTMASASC